MTDALIIVDMQNDFLPGGALPVKGGFEIVEPILDLAEGYGERVAKTADQHPSQTSHFDRWPRHCVRGTAGAELLLAIGGLYGTLFPKGRNAGEDAYSGFSTPALHGWLQELGATDVTVVGLALDYCVKETALDARRLGYHVTVDLAATRPVTYQGGQAAYAELAAAGVEVVQ